LPPQGNTSSDAALAVSLPALFVAPEASLPRLTLLGCGRVGRTLAHAWVRAGIFDIGQIITRQTSTAVAAQAFIGQGEAGTNSPGLQLAPAQVFLIATSDDQIVPTAAILAASGVTNQATVIFHCSGVLGSDVLRAAGLTGQIASVHPAHAFSTPVQEDFPLQHVGCACEGDALALQLLCPAFSRLGGRPFNLAPEHKTLYHTAACVASNYLVGLAACADQLFRAAGVEPAQARLLTQHLQANTLANIASGSPQVALTGPLQRRDLETIQKHLDALAPYAPEIRQAYEALALLTTHLLVPLQGVSGAMVSPANEDLSGSCQIA